jgi:hypothetical protein
MAACNITSERKQRRDVTTDHLHFGDLVLKCSQLGAQP